MKCYQCPMIKEQFDSRIARLDDICGLIEWDEVMYEHAAYCYCEKVGGKPTIYGFCSEAEGPTKEEWDTYREKHNLQPIEDEPIIDLINEPINEPITETKKQKKRRRDRKHFNKQKRLYKALERWYPTPIWPRYEHDEWWRTEDERGDILYFRGYHHNRFKQWLKKQSNKKIRRTKGLTRKGNVWKKVFDLWWELW